MRAGLLCRRGRQIGTLVLAGTALFALYQYLYADDEEETDLRSDDEVTWNEHQQKEAMEGALVLSSPARERRRQVALRALSGTETEPALGEGGGQLRAPLGGGDSVSRFLRPGREGAGLKGGGARDGRLGCGSGRP